MMAGMGAIGFTLFTFVYGHFGPQLPGIVQADVDALIQIEKSGKKADQLM
jgi:hypothetical protein